ncbi:MAG: hypothetical protein WB788_06730 [Thermoplasmata archaeon]
MSSNNSPTSGSVAFGEPDPEDREERRRLGLTEKEREALIHEPGPSWREWFYTQAFRWWLGLAFLIIDAWIVAGWLQVNAWLPLAASLVAAIYLEFLLWQYLWHVYNPELRGKFRPSWHSPFEVGRWSPDRERVLRGDVSPTPGSGPDPREFL